MLLDYSGMSLEARDCRFARRDTEELLFRMQIFVLWKSTVVFCLHFASDRVIFTLLIPCCARNCPKSQEALSNDLGRKAPISGF